MVFMKVIFSTLVFSVASVDHVLLSPDDGSHACFTEPLSLSTQYKIYFLHLPFNSHPTRHSADPLCVQVYLEC